jgi:23S rRNA pseudouridine955/2504/2580 synthase
MITGNAIGYKLLKDKQALGEAGSFRGVRRETIDADAAGQRLDNFLTRELRGVPRGHVYRLLRKGQVRVNGGRRKPTYRLVAGDEVRLPPVRLAERVPVTGPLRRVEALLETGVLFEDEALLILDKPAGMPVHGGSGLHGGLIEALRILRDESGLELAHRLDRDTSGCIVIARRRKALRALHDAFRRGGVDKQYLSLLAGRVNSPFEVDAPLARYEKRGGERHVTVRADGKSALTRFKPVAPAALGSLVRARPVTGRTHQIRVHAAHAGHPVVGDTRYGDKAAERAFKEAGLRRLALHAERLVFAHPFSGEQVEVLAPLPEDLAPAVKTLTGYES